MTVLEQTNAPLTDPQRRRAVRGGAVAELVGRIADGDDEALAVLPFVDAEGAPAVVEGLLSRAFDRSCRPGRREELAALAAALSSGAPDASLLEQLHDASEETRVTAAVALGARGNHVAIPALVEAAGDASPRVRAAAVRALCDVGGHEAGAALARLLERAERSEGPLFDDELVGALLQGVACAERARAEACLLAHLGHASVDVRLAALSALRGLSSVVRTDAVRALLTDADARVRLHALSVLERHGGAADGEAAVERLSDPDPRVRAMARDAVRAIGRERFA